MKIIRKVHLASLLDLLVRLEEDGVEYIDVSGHTGKRGMDRMLVDVWEDYFFPGMGPQKPIPREEINGENFDDLIY